MKRYDPHELTRAYEGHEQLVIVKANGCRTCGV